MRVHSVSRGWSAVQHMMNNASHVCETNTNYGDLTGEITGVGRRWPRVSRAGTSTQECEGASQWVGRRDLQQQQRSQRSFVLNDGL